ncbi:MAG: RagB/SusD family nutrient uptake outer membrane protein [Prevotella sp.]|jgi:hypothetical protein|nr:RagB/SusD family nutrient uptake outer membrane protein [Prevotella sp.]
MKKKLSYFRMFVIAGLLSITASCNDYLDEIPDNRTEIDTPEKVALLLTGSYPEATYAAMLNPRVDNVTDKGTGTISDVNRDSYFWREVQNTSSQDTPYYVWRKMFHSIAGANGALDAIERLSTTEKVKTQLAPYKGEALTLRAFGHFILGAIFCKFYNPEQNDKNLGLPYVVEQETTINTQYDRGTVGQLWANIQADLEAGLPLIGSNDLYVAPKYHFNKNAAYAFATRFYLYKGETADLQKTVEMANTVFPQPDVVSGTNVAANDPAAIFAVNNFQPWNTIYQAASSSDDIKLAFAQTSNPSILLVSDVTSYMGQYTNSWRYATASPDINRTAGAATPAGAAFGYKVFHSGEWNYYVPKFRSFFKRTSISATTGVYHAAYPFFRMEEILINRAEAYARLDRYDEAVADLNILCRTRIVNYNESTHLLTLKRITDFYAATVNDADFYMNKYNAFGSQSWPVEKKALVHFVLVCRQNEFLHESLRYWDMIRYKIESVHRTTYTEGDVENILYPDDDRWVVQLPQTVQLAGMELNPMTNLLSPKW